MEEFVMGMVFGAVCAGFVVWLAVNDRHDITSACQGKPWVIEEPLIKKTLTCSVEVKK